VLTSVVYRHRRVAAMTVLIEPFASVYYDRSCLGVIFARGRNGFEAYAADDHSLGLFPSPRKAAAAITMTRSWVAQRPPGQTRTQSTDPNLMRPLANPTETFPTGVTARHVRRAGV
jgi:hypothetical protein